MNPFNYFSVDDKILEIKSQHAANSATIATNYLKNSSGKILNPAKSTTFATKSDGLDIWRSTHLILKNAGFPGLELKNIFTDIPTSVLLKQNRGDLVSILTNYIQELPNIKKDEIRSSIEITIKTIRELINDKDWPGNKNHKTKIYTDWSIEELNEFTPSELIAIWTNYGIERKKMKFGVGKEYRNILLKIRNRINKVLDKKRKELVDNAVEVNS